MKNKTIMNIFTKGIERQERKFIKRRDIKAGNDFEYCNLDKIEVLGYLRQLL